VSLIMAVSVLALALTVKEKRLSEENRALEKQHPDWNLAAKDESGNEVLPKEVKRSLTFLLASISLWFIAYNGVTTWFTKYIEQVMGEGLGGASTCLLVATAGAICSYIPIGALAAKIGRKRYNSAWRCPADALLPARLTSLPARPPSSPGDVRRFRPGRSGVGGD